MKKVLIGLLFVVSVFASDDEIGKLFIEKSDGHIDSAVLASDGKSFYTFKDGWVSKYGINPLKKIYSFQTSIIPPYYRYAIYVTSDEQKMVIASNKELILVDLKTKKIINRVTFESRGRHVMNGKNFITVGREIIHIREGVFDEGDNLMTVWDTKQLKKIKEIKLYDTCDIWEDCYEADHYFADDAKALYKVNDRLIYVSVYTIAILDATNLEIMQKVYKYRNYGVYLGRNSNFIYSHYYTSLGDDYKKARNSYAAINLETCELSKEKKYSSGNPKLNDLELKNLSVKEKIKLLSFKTSNAFWIGKKAYKLHQYKNGELIIERHSTFEATSLQIRKDLKMKTEDGRIVPMNEATYKKYHTQIKLGE